MSDLVGRTLLNRYRVLELVGRGGMAEVYKVYDQERATHLALKLLREDLAQDPVFLRRFKREAQTLAKLQHPNIVRFYGLEQDELLAFILMDYVDGESLRTEIFRARGQGMSPERILEVMTPICSALHYAHRRGMVHCDLKPGNVMIEKTGRVLVSDFGIARMTDAATATMVGAGTPAYMAPEQIKGADPTPQTDIYALGVVLFEMLTGGERPFTGEQAPITGTTGEKVRWEHLNLEPPSPRKWNQAVTSELEAAVLRCLDKNPQSRYSDIQDLLSALSKTLIQVETPAERDFPTAKAREPQVQSVGVDQEEHLASMGRTKTTNRKWIVAWVLLAVLGLVSIVLIIGGLNDIGLDEITPPTNTSTIQAIIEAEHTPTSSRMPSPANVDSSTATAACSTHLAQFPGTPCPVLPTVTITPITSNDPPQTISAGSIRESDIDGMEMVYIPAATFMMGSDDGEEDEQPVHEVYLDAYWIDRTEVTNAMFATFLTEMGNQYQGGTTWMDTDSEESRIRLVDNQWLVSNGYEDHPVTQVDWYGAQAYCTWVGRRLPTEAEWEYAARGNDQRAYPWGGSIPSCIFTNFSDCEDDSTAVGLHPKGASPFGVQDMSGNAREWVADWYQENYYEESPNRNPPGPNVGLFRVLRGGSWYDVSSYLTVTARIPNSAATHGYNGFRCALSE
jgi:serine/threonine-protein kinase